MQFIADNTPRDAKFIILSTQAWFEADDAEWFPLLADRQSLTTPQGLEWISSSKFLEISADTYDLSALLRSSQAGNDADEIVKYVEKKFKDFDYIVIFAKNLDEKIGGFLQTGRFDIVYFRKNVLIFLRTQIPGDQ
jgi:hypothetical protein